MLTFFLRCQIFSSRNKIFQYPGTDFSILSIYNERFYDYIFHVVMKFIISLRIYMYQRSNIRICIVDQYVDCHKTAIIISEFCLREYNQWRKDLSDMGSCIRQIHPFCIQVSTCVACQVWRELDVITLFTFTS